MSRDELIEHIYQSNVGAGRENAGEVSIEEWLAEWMEINLEEWAPHHAPGLLHDLKADGWEIKRRESDD